MLCDDIVSVSVVVLLTLPFFLCFFFSCCVHVYLYVYLRSLRKSSTFYLPIQWSRMIIICLSPYLMMEAWLFDISFANYALLLVAPNLTAIVADNIVVQVCSCTCWLGWREKEMGTCCFVCSRWMWLEHVVLIWDVAVLHCVYLCVSL